MDGLFTVSDIKNTKKGRYALFCDGEFLFSVDEETLLKHGLEKGSVLTKPELDALEKEAALVAASGADAVIIQDLMVLELFKRRYHGVGVRPLA